MTCNRCKELEKELNRYTLQYNSLLKKYNELYNLVKPKETLYCRDVEGNHLRLL